MVYTDGACINNGDKNTAAGLGIWYGENDPRNVSMRVPHKTQSNQTGELLAILIAIRNHPPQEDVLIVSDSRYVIDGLTKNARRWEERNWIDTQHGPVFKCITAWMRWREGKTSLKWVKGHSGVTGNEGADKLAGEGALKPDTDTYLTLDPPDTVPTGAAIQKLEQRDFYDIIVGMKRIPVRSKTVRNVENIKACIKETVTNSSFTHQNRKTLLRDS